MSPSRRPSTGYRPKRDRREVTIAVATGVAIGLFTVLMVWILGPHDSGSSYSPSTTTTPAATARHCNAGKSGAQPIDSATSETNRATGSGKISSGHGTAPGISASR